MLFNSSSNKIYLLAPFKVLLFEVLKKNNERSKGKKVGGDALNLGHFQNTKHYSCL